MFKQWVWAPSCVPDLFFSQWLDVCIWAAHYVCVKTHLQSASIRFVMHLDIRQSHTNLLTLRLTALCFTSTGYEITACLTFPPWLRFSWFSCHVWRSYLVSKISWLTRGEKKSLVRWCDIHRYEEKMGYAAFNVLYWRNLGLTYSNSRFLVEVANKIV